MFGEIFLYLKTAEQQYSWKAVVIYPSRSVESSWIIPYVSLINSAQVIRIYLDELEEKTGESLGVATLKLITLPATEVIGKAKELIEKTLLEKPQPSEQRDLIELIETIIVYKFPKLGRKEIEAMLEVGDLRETKFFQEAKQEGRQEGRQEGLLEGKTKAVLGMLALGGSISQIAQLLDLSEEEVRRIAQQSS